MRFFIAAVALLSILVIGGNWEITGPGGAAVTLIANDLENTERFFVLVHYWQGISDYVCYRSVDEGISWERVSVVSENANFLTTDHFGRVFCSTSDSLFISTDSA